MTKYSLKLFFNKIMILPMANDSDSIIDCGRTGEGVKYSDTNGQKKCGRPLSLWMTPYLLKS